MTDTLHERVNVARGAEIGSVADVRAIEDRLIRDWGYPVPVMMERAAVAVVRLLESQFGRSPVVVVSGMGNNGADGLAVARILHDRGYTVRVLTVGASPGDWVRKQSQGLRQRGVQPKGFSGSEAYGSEWVLVDALYGIGLNRALRSEATLAIEWMNRQNWRAVVALDVPSGLDADTGEHYGALVRAHHTVSMGVLKPGLLMDRALESVGRLWLADIGFPALLTAPLSGRLNEATPLPPIPAAAHKGTLGSVLVLAGSRTMTGAAILALRGAGRSGVGLVYGGVVVSQRDLVAVAVPEAIVLPLREEEGSVGPEALDLLAPQLGSVKAVAIGPGLRHTPRVQAMVERLLTLFAGPVVLDADALPYQAQRLPQRTGPIIMTPHPGELGRMLGISATQVQKQRLDSALQAAKTYQAIVVLKGARTIIANPAGRYTINVTGDPILATAGAGDVLTGFMVGLLARGFDAEAAARTAVHLHGQAAQAAREAGMVSLMANDIPDRIPRLLGQITEVLPALGDLRLVR